MATLTQNYRPNVLRIAFARKRDALIERLMPRRCMVVSVGMIVAGIGIPALMAFDLLPISLLLGFVGFALAAVGGVLALVYCGEL
ncbi:MAG TPA: hypothetical protein VIS72_18015 [Anaerolineales bacterium]